MKVVGRLMRRRDRSSMIIMGVVGGRMGVALDRFAMCSLMTVMRIWLMMSRLNLHRSVVVGMRILDVVAMAVDMIARMRVSVVVMLGHVRGRVCRYLGVMPVLRMVGLVSSPCRMSSIHLRQSRLPGQPLVVRKIGQLTFQLSHRERLFRVRRVHDVGPDTPQGAVLGLGRSRAGRIEDVAEFGFGRGDLEPIGLGLIPQAIAEAVVVFPQFVAQPDHGVSPSSSRVRVHGGRRLQE